MENASKALIFAGGLLITMLIVAALFFTTNQVRNLKSQEQLAEQTDEVAEYNNKFNKYASDNLYGVDLISLCNEVSNYNAKEHDNKNYHEIELEFDFSHSTSNPLGEYIKKDKYYYRKDNDPKESSNTNLYKQYMRFEDFFNSKANKPITGLNGNQYTIKQLASMRNDESMNKVGKKSNQIDEIGEYNSLKSELTEFKTKKFKGEITEQDSTGRITKMTFTT